jgi:4-diphosphocytidyl-2-C-methyl-D-erythritol kinase
VSQGPIQLVSPAKINLHLRVGPLAADGFHPLLSWMCTVGLADTLHVRETKSPGIRLACNRPDVPIDRTNLICRAGAALAPDRGAEVHLEKHIPLGGGLGGGSSNAATALVAFNELWQLGHTRESLAAVAAKLGSDVPFFLYGPSSICRGRGEQVRPIPPPAPRHLVLILPTIHMSTPAIYRRFDEMKMGSLDAIERAPDFASWCQLKADDLLPKLVNDLEPPAFAHTPELGLVRDKIEQQIQRVVRMSGSGSTLFTLADNADVAADLAAKITELGVLSHSYDLLRVARSNDRKKS